MDINKISLLRKLVFLGFEKNNWCNQIVLTKNSNVFLEYILPQSKVKVYYNLANKIFCIEHDQNIKDNTIHFFGLEQNITILLNAIVFFKIKTFNNNNFIK
ncbi:MAG: hypothetical protein J0M25_03145 [Flavobacteriales bacterium]|nr:hypothetical protein [Flavobacteriales bacterium]